MNNRVFVYGSLMGGHAVRGLHKFTGVKKINNATTSKPDYSLFSLGAFPAVTLNGPSKINGEVWAVDDTVFAELDAIEGYPDFYNRVEVATTSGVAWMYYLPDYKALNAGQRVIADDDNIARWTNEEATSSWR